MGTPPEFRWNRDGVAVLSKKPAIYSCSIARFPGDSTAFLFKW